MAGRSWWRRLWDGPEDSPQKIEEEVDAFDPEDLDMELIAFLAERLGVTPEDLDLSPEQVEEIIGYLPEGYEGFVIGEEPVEVVELSVEITEELPEEPEPEEKAEPVKEEPVKKTTNTRPTLHIMVDLESLGTDTDALVTEIAAMTFEMDSKENQHHFSKMLRLDSLDTIPVNVSTLNFWMKDKANADKLKNLLNPTPLEATRRVGPACLWAEFHSWLSAVVKQYPDHDIRIWGNGIGFDIAKMNYNFEQMGLKSPISFRGEMDMRTLLYYAGVVSGQRRDEINAKFNNRNPHNALADVRYQIEVVQYCNAVLTEG